MAGEIDSQESHFGGSPSRVTLGQVVSIAEQESDANSHCATVNVDSLSLLKFFSDTDPSFSSGDYVPVAKLDDDELPLSHDWVATRGSGRWRLCTGESTAPKRQSHEMLVVPEWAITG